MKEEVFSTTDSNKIITLSVSLGIFVGILPVWGYQMLIAFGVAQMVKLNKAIALVASNISIPPMIPFILWGSYITGGLVLGKSSDLLEFTFATMKQNLFQYLIGSVIFAAICSVSFGLITYLLLSIFRKKKKS
jgi:uncharacterized protein (DUF2062 family)